MRRWALIGVLAPAVALAQKPPEETREGAILFGRFGSIYQQSATLIEPAREIVELPDDAAEIRWMEAIRDGRLVVVTMVERPIWLFAPDPTKPARVMSNGACVSAARPNPWGGCLVCQGPDGPMLVAAGRIDQAPLPGPLLDAAFRGPSGLEMLARAPEGVIGFDRTKPAERRVLARNEATSHLLAAPDGTKAVALFGEGDAARIRTFLLDGTGVSRQLGGPGIPTLWSWDSAWVLFQEGDISGFNREDDEGGDPGLGELDAESRFLFAAPAKSKKKSTKKPPPAKPASPPIRACVARAAGGEVKCWDHYTGVAFSPDSREVLLKRDRSLYIGRIAGVRPEPPRKVIDDVDGAATWVPNPIAVPLPNPTPPPAPASQPVQPVPYPQ